MFEQRSSRKELSIYVYILNSELGKAERDARWTRFCQEFCEQTELPLLEAPSIERADFIFLATGGVEGLYASHFDHLRLPTAFYAPRQSNAFAAMNEIRGFLNLRGQNAFCYDEDLFNLKEFVTIARARRLLDQSQIAIWGASAPWLVASSPSRDAFQHRFQATIHHHSWETLGWQETQASSEIMERWKSMPAFGVREDEFTNACKLSTAMLQWAYKHRVDAMLVGCFPLLAQHVSACLAVSDLLDNGYVAACENDLCAAIGMLVADYLKLAIQPPWMANLVDNRGDEITLQHCTVAKACLQQSELMTHFESNANVAIGGKFAIKCRVTVYRFDERFEHATIHEGHVIHSAPNPVGCRTSATIRLREPLKKPLGNHHIVIYGHHAKILRAFCQMMNIIVD